MIREVAGDILLTKAKVLAHGVAPNDNFATGLALALRERWPAMYKGMASLRIESLMSNEQASQQLSGMRC